MTTFQDPPHQSRRAVRRSEVRPDEQTEVDAPARPTTARTGRRAQLPSATEWQDGDGTEAKPTRAASPMIEPFTLATHSVPQMPTYTPASHSAPVDPNRVERPRPAPGRRVSLAAGEAAPTSAIPVISLDTAASDAPVVVAAPEESAPAAEATAETATADTVNTDTVDTPVVADQPAPADDVVASEVAAPAKPVVERTMTRRELREMRVAAERAAGLEVPEAIGAILNSGTIILPYLSSGPTRRVEEANAEFDALTQAPANESADPDFPVAPVSTWDMPLESPHHADTTTDNGTASSAPALIEPPQAASVAPPTGRVDEDDDDAVDESDQVTVVDASAPAAGTAGPTIVEPATSPTSTRSAGHWSVRADMDEDIESLENTLTRTVGSTGAITTSALVLPSVPQSSDITSPFTASGETMVTGSIDLPRSLGASGVHPGRVDTSDFDLDPLDREVPTTDSAPVRAIRAVSTHTSSNGMVTSKKPQGNRMLTGMVVLASTMAVGVAGLLIAGFALQLFP
jgi:hypothetical protein